MVRTASERTLLAVQIQRVEWKVEDMLCDGSQDSGIFDFCWFQWRLCLETKKTLRIFCSQDICITLSIIKSSGSKMIGIQSFIEDRNKKALYSREHLFWTSEKCSLEVWNMKLCGGDLSEMKDELTADGYINGLTFVFILTWFLEDQNVKKESEALQAAIDAEADASSECLIVDFRRLLDDGTHSDVTLKCGDHAVPVHRNILSARSEVLAAMLSTDMAESRTGVVEISDMTPPVFDQLVKFIYLAELSDLTMETAQHLYAAGDKYAIDTLKRQCSAFIKNNLTDANVCSVVVLAEAHSDADLKEWAVLYIIRTELMGKDDIWLKFCDDHPKLAMDMLNRVYKEVVCFKQPK